MLELRVLIYFIILTAGNNTAAQSVPDLCIERNCFLPGIALSGSETIDFATAELVKSAGECSCFCEQKSNIFEYYEAWEYCSCKKVTFDEHLEYKLVDNILTGVFDCNQRDLSSYLQDCPNIKYEYCARGVLGLEATKKGTTILKMSGINSFKLCGCQCSRYRDCDSFFWILSNSCFLLKNSDHIESVALGYSGCLPTTSTTTTTTTTAISPNTTATSKNTTITSENITISSENTTATFENTTATFENTTATFENTTSRFENTTATFENSTATFENTTTTFENTTAIFENTTATFENTTATFENTTATFENTTATSENTTATFENTTATLENTTATFENTTIISENTTAKYENTTAKYENTTISSENTTANFENTIATYENTTATYENTTATFENTNYI
ncbi:cell wall protein DAN4 [Eurytemora carolleeae]|uniref:cell wall protein DAN4 n=1 Tax=Eurytemora carolleeae TaxID=1294199 RepID=UPI000C767B88|nr:cell wall protein DAN4 [Eurytemora carolleeae]|eukprot:XP_023329459.1 cell wall protein DAN4-like [Eurytemora affinis]